MALTYLAGQRLTADALQRAVPDRVTQAVDQNVISSTTLVDSAIEITVDDLLSIDLELRYSTGTAGGGFRWAWASTGSVTLVSRSIGAAGSTTTGSPTVTADMYWRNWNSLTGVSQVTQFNNTSTNRVSEVLVVSGSGVLTLQFAQDTSVAVNTTLFADSYALISRLGS